MNSTARRPLFFRAVPVLAALATFSLGAVEATAADITVVNHSNVGIHPYFKSNCWNGTTMAKTKDWVYFGGILGGTQFTWDGFQALLDPACRKAMVKFTYVPFGDPAPTHASKRKTVTLKPFDLSELYRIELGTEVVITNVDPDQDDHDD